MLPHRSLARVTRSVTAFLSAVALTAALAGCSGGSEDNDVLGSDKASSGSSSDAGGDDPDGSSAEAAEFEVESGFTSGKDSINTVHASAGARLTNPSTDQAAYGVQVLFNLIGPGDAVLDSTTETVSYIGPGETVPVAPLQIGFDLEQEPTGLEVHVVGELSDDEGPKDSFASEMSVLDVKDAKVVASDFGRELDAQVSNPTAEVVTDANWDCIYLDGDKIVGGQSSAIVDPIPPGATVQFSDYLSIDDMVVKDVECRVLSSY